MVNETLWINLVPEDQVLLVENEIIIVVDIDILKGAILNIVDEFYNFDGKQLKIGKTMGILRSFLWNYVKYGFLQRQLQFMLYTG